MYRNYKIVVNTAAGRRRYMQYLVPFVLSSDVVDRYDIWVHTHNGADIEFFKQLADKYEKVNLCWQPDGVVNGNPTINAFYRDCIDEDTIYFKLDDDIVWMEADAIKKMVDFRIDNPNYFLVTPLVINNSLSTYLLQVMDKIKLSHYCNSSASHALLWKSGDIATSLHNWFIEKYLKTGKYTFLHVGKHEMGMTRFSINAILWFGKDMNIIKGIVPGDDEEFLSCIYPTHIGKANCWNGDVVMAHFAFYTQREQLDKNGILEKYGAFISTQKKAKYYSYYEVIQKMITEISHNEAEYMAKPSPYRKEIISKKENSRKEKIRKFITKFMRPLAIRLYHKVHTVDLIVE